MKNIWIINHYANDMFINEGGRHYSFAEKLANRGYNPIIICASTFHNNDRKIEINGLYKSNFTKKVPFIFIKTKQGNGNGLERILNMYSFYRNLLKAYKDIMIEIGKPDIILASSVHPLTLLAGIKISKTCSIPCISEIRDLWPEAIFSFKKIRENSFIGKFLVAGEHYIYKQSDALIFTKEGDIDYLKEHEWLDNQGGDIEKTKCFYINNGVDINKFDDLKKEKPIISLPKGSFNVLYIGSIRPVNNVDSILEVAKTIRAGINFYIIGQGIEKKKLEEKVKIEKIDNVHFLGSIKKGEVPAMLVQSNLNLLNYSSETYNWSRGNSSNKLFEYMAAGKPVLSTVQMGYSPIKKYNCGVELKDSTIKTYKDAIQKIYDLSTEEYEELSNNSRIAAGDFDFEILTDKLVEVINYSEHKEIK